MYRVIITAIYNFVVALFGVCVIAETVTNLINNTAFPKIEIAIIGIIMFLGYLGLQVLAFKEFEDEYNQLKQSKDANRD